MFIWIKFFLSTRSFPKIWLNAIVYMKFRDTDTVRAGTVENTQERDFWTCIATLYPMVSNHFINIS